ncbi:MAG: outer membrane protein assembly factor BamA [Akkermansia sp.]|nr:outer membrane protein assembly factor BamA [Akkermansia sp.]
MNARTLSWSATLMALAMTVSMPARAQDSTGDPFLDAMLSDQQAAEEAQEKTPAVGDSTTAPAVSEGDSSAPKVEARLTRPTDNLVGVGNDVMEREFGDSTAVFANDHVYDGKTVKSVRIRYISGKAVLPEQRLLDVVQTRSGTKYSSVRVSEDLERLIKNGFIDGDARVAVEPTGGGVRVIFEVRPTNVMAGVGFTGNTYFDDEELREGLTESTTGGLKPYTSPSTLSSGTAFNDQRLAAARARIIQMYKEAGYPDTKVSWRYKNTARAGYSDVVFDIQEGREVRMMNIDFEGNTAFDDVQLRQVMKTKERGLFTWFTKSGRVDREQVEDDLAEIVRLYRNYGYLRARVGKVEYFDRGKSDGPQKLTMRVTIEEGPMYKVRNVSFSGNNVYSADQLMKGMSMIGGDIYSLQKVSDDSVMIRRYYGAKGYADADVRPDINEVGVDEKGRRLVDINYQVHEGGRYAVGKINVLGNTKTKPYVILRELPLKPGQPLNSVDLETARKRLNNLNYFSGVEVSQTSSATPGYRDVNVNVQEKMTGQFQVGVAFSSIESVYLYASITQSNFDLGGFTNGTFVGGGQRLSISGRVGTETQGATIHLLDPWFLDRKISLGNELYYSRSTYMSDYYEQANLGYCLTLRKAIDDYRSFKVQYRIEQYEIEPEAGAPIFFEANGGDYTRSNIRLAYEYDSRDAQITPRKGGHLELFGSWSGPGSTVETVSGGLTGSYYYNSFWDSIFSVNFGIETIDTLDSNEEVPLFERCYLGGPNNLRGFRYRDVGMVDEALAGDETMGGRSSAYVQLEMTLPLVDSLRFAVFADAGFVNADAGDFSTSNYSADVGFGLRLNLPMGPIAVDYAIPVKTGQAIDRSGQFQFYVDYKY